MSGDIEDMRFGPEVRDCVSPRCPIGAGEKLGQFAHDKEGACGCETGEAGPERLAEVAAGDAGHEGGGHRGTDRTYRTARHGCGNAHDGAEDGHLAEQVADRLEGLVPEAAEEAVA